MIAQNCHVEPFIFFFFFTAAAMTAPFQQQGRGQPPPHHLSVYNLLIHIKNLLQAKAFQFAYISIPILVDVLLSGDESNLAFFNIVAYLYQRNSDFILLLCGQMHQWKNVVISVLEMCIRDSLTRRKYSAFKEAYLLYLESTR